MYDLVIGCSLIERKKKKKKKLLNKEKEIVIENLTVG